MDGGTWLGLIVGLFGAGVLAACWAQWRGLGRGEDPDALTERHYLLAPIGLMFLLLGLVFLLASLFPALDGTVLGEAVYTLLLWAAGLSGLAGIVLWAWHPRWLRPAWQRRQVEAHQARKVRPRGSGPFTLEVLVDREPIPHPQRFGDEEDAVALAREILRDDPRAEHVVILDTRLGYAVRQIGR